MKSPLVWRGLGREREASLGDVSVQTEREETISGHFRIWCAAKEYKKKSRPRARDNEQKDWAQAWTRSRVRLADHVRTWNVHARARGTAGDEQADQEQDA